MRYVAILLFLAQPVYGAIPQAPKLAQAPARTLCGCAHTGKCECYAGDCRCPACGAGGAAKQAGKFSNMQRTVVQTAERRTETRTSSAGTPPTVTYTLVPAVGLSGTTSNCPNGQCSNPRSRR